MSARAHEYRAYLDSPEWAEKREAVRLRALGRCEFACGRPMAQVHHVRYPKRLGDEPLSDLLAVCDECHKKSHGIRGMTKFELVPGGQPQEFKTPAGTRLVVVSSENGNVYATIEAWLDAVRPPRIEAQRLRHKIELMQIQNTAPGKQPFAVWEGATVVRWSVVAEVLYDWDRHLQARYQNPENRREKSREEWSELLRYSDSIRDLNRWGWALQEQAISGRLAAVATVPVPVPRAEVPQWLETGMRALVDTAVQQKHQVAQLELAVYADPDEWITVPKACVELRHPAETIVYGSNNLEAEVGRRLRAAGCESGPRVATRLSGSGHVVQVNQWRRADVYRIAAEVLGKSFEHLLARRSA